MSGAHSRRKGAGFERVLVQRFREVMPDVEVRRGLQYRAGEEAADVEIPCFWVEAKHHRKVNIRQAFRQALAACKPGRWPVAICKDNREEPLVTMQLDDFLDLVREWWARRDR
jgi:hypothetical protein